MTRSLLCALTLTSLLSACARRAPSPSPFELARAERESAIRAIDLPVARAAGTPAIAPMVRVVITASGIDIDALELDGARAPAPLVHRQAVALDGLQFRPQDVRGGEHGFHVPALQEAMLRAVAARAPTAAARHATPFALIAPRTTPTITMYRVLYTLGQAGFTTPVLAMRRGAEIVGVHIDVRQSARSGAASRGRQLSMIARDGTLTLRSEPATDPMRVAAEAAARALALIEGRDSGAQPEDASAAAVPEERASLDGATIDRAVIAQAIRRVWAQPAQPESAPPQLAASKRTSLGTVLELLELTEYDLSLPAPQLAILND